MYVQTGWFVRKLSSKGLDRPSDTGVWNRVQPSGGCWPWQAGTEYTFRTRTLELKLGLTLTFGLEERGWSPIIRQFRI